jgi:hypothetical protein
MARYMSFSTSQKPSVNQKKPVSEPELLLGIGKCKLNWSAAHG